MISDKSGSLPMRLKALPFNQHSQKHWMWYPVSLPERWASRLDTNRAFSLCLTGSLILSTSVLCLPCLEWLLWHWVVELNIVKIFLVSWLLSCLICCFNSPVTAFLTWGVFQCQANIITPAHNLFCFSELREMNYSCHFNLEWHPHSTNLHLNV